MSGDEELSGGYLTCVVRRGDTVRRGTGPWTPAVHELLRHLRAVGFDRAPAVLGLADGGATEVLTHLPGHVLEYPPRGWFWEPTWPFELGRLLRELHEAAAALLLPDGVRWESPYPPEGPPEVVCHGDFSPTNCLFLDGRPVAVIDFDLAGPGPRLWDLASAVYRTAPLHAPELFERWGEPVPDEGVQQSRLRAVLDGYGQPFEGSLLDVLTAQLERHIRLITSDEHFARARREGHDAAYRIDLDWLSVRGSDLIGS